MSELIKTVLGMAILLGTLVMFHELGHFTVAKLFKIRVDEFAFGFGPKWITLFKRGETEYTIHPITLGGFVKLAGEDHGSEQVEGSFQSKPWWVRYLVFTSGPVASFILAILVFTILGLTVGLPIADKAFNKVDLVEPNSIADNIGIRSGDSIVEINGRKISTGEEMLTVIHGSANKTLTLTLDRNGKLIKVTGKPRAQKFPDGKTYGVFGFMPKQKLVRVGLGQSLKYGGETTVMFVKSIVTVLTTKQIKTSVGGPLAIADATRTSVKRGVNGFLQLMAILSVSLGVINLLPIPVMDGGQMVLVLAEGIKGKRLSDTTMEIAQKIGLALIAAIFLFIMYMDLSKVIAGKLFR